MDLKERNKNINIMRRDLKRAREEWNHKAAAMIRTELYVLYGIWEGEE